MTTSTPPPSPSPVRSIDKTICVQPRHYRMVMSAMKRNGITSFSQMVGKIIDQAEAVKVPVLREDAK